MISKSLDFYRLLSYIQENKGAKCSAAAAQFGGLAYGHGGLSSNGSIRRYGHDVLAVRLKRVARRIKSGR